MNIDFWTLGLQAINVAVLVWLLSRVFWKPIAAAIAARQATTTDLLDSAKATQAKVEAALAEVTKARAGIDAERSAVLAEAATKADAASKDILAKAHTAAEALLASATQTAEAKAQTARVAADRASVTLAVDIARKLLAGLDSDAVQAAFLARLVKGIAAMSPQDRSALVTSDDAIDLVSADDLTPKAQKTITKTIHDALGATPRLHFVTDPALIAGSELRTPHFTLHNSWRADLAAIEKGLSNAA